MSPTMMTAKEELIQAIERSPDDLVWALLELLRVLQRQSSNEMSLEHQKPVLEEVPRRLYHKQGILVIETEPLTGFDTNTLIAEMREERIQSQIG